MQLCRCHLHNYYHMGQLEFYYCHSGSFCHPRGNPIAAGSTTGYFESRVLNPGSNCYLYMLNGRKEEYAQLFIEMIEAHYLGKSGIRLERMLLPVSLH